MILIFTGEETRTQRGEITRLKSVTGPGGGRAGTWAWQSDSGNILTRSGLLSLLGFSSPCGDEGSSPLPKLHLLVILLGNQTF